MFTFQFATRSLLIPLSMDNRFKRWLKRVGWVGFFFFLIKGLLWLLIPYLIARGVLTCEG